MKLQKIQIYVTQEDIDKGVKGEALLCPVARAIARRLHMSTSERWVAATWLGVSLEDDRGVAESYHALPARVVEFMKKFDKRNTNRRYLKPFRFIIEVPESWLKN